MSGLTPLFFTWSHGNDTLSWRTVGNFSYIDIHWQTIIESNSLLELVSPLCPSFQPPTKCLTLQWTSTIFVDFSNCFSVLQYCFSRFHCAGYTWTRFVVSSKRYPTFKLNLLEFRYHFIAFQKPCILRGFPRYLNWESRRSRNFYQASSFWTFQSTMLMSKIRGTSP
jgi:hypothetical protein